ncbi:MAG: VWA domain-containing protein [Planctomycetota bacterium]
MTSLCAAVMADDSSRENRRPLDLPSGGSGSNDNEEDITESITFYGAEFEGDGFFWCLDKSGSMIGDQFATLQSEVTMAIQQLSANAEFGLVAFSSNHVVWRENPSRATSNNKLAAIGWVQALAAGGGTMISPAGVATLEICNHSQKNHRAVIVLGDGLPADESVALEEITGANYQSVPINTILIADVGGIPFMQMLAGMNQGTFKFID